MTNCKSCNSEVTQNFCPNCGLSANLKRINGHYITHEIEHVLHFEKGILYTIKELLIRPGESIRRFISEDRSKLVKPVIFIVITSLIYTIIFHYFKLESTINSALPADSTAAKLEKWTLNHLGYSNILMGALIACYIKLFFRKSSYNFFEIVILLCFVMGIGMLFIALFLVIEGITHIDLKTIGTIIAFGYCSWAIAQFYGGKKWTTYLKAFTAYVLGGLSYTLLSMLIGGLVDLVIK